MKVNNSALIGRQTKDTALLEYLIRANALNQTGTLDYNKYGTKDGIGIVECNDVFVDNFLLSLLVPGHLIKDKKFGDCSILNTEIRRMLKDNGLIKCSVKAVTLKRVKQLLTRHQMEGRRYNEDGASTFYWQIFKVACSDETMANVMSFLREKKYKQLRWLHLIDIDCTIDCQGSFQKDEVIDHMVRQCGFVLQNTDHSDDSPGTIIENDAFVGKNCLTYMTQIDGMKLRCKLYNKFVQSIETNAVRKIIGQHWKDWVENEHTCLSRNKHEAKNRGLTRIEVTFYCDDQSIPSDMLIKEALQGIKSNLPKELVYSTPYEMTWRAYCEALVHTLIVVEKNKVAHQDAGSDNSGGQSAVLVYSYNEVTGKISGQIIKLWDRRDKWCIANLALGANLPVDIIEIDHVENVLVKRSNEEITRMKRHLKIRKDDHEYEKKVKEITYEPDELLVINGKRYFRCRKDGRIDFKTQVVLTGHSHGTVVTDQARNDKKLEDAGFVPHENCIPSLSGQGQIDNKKVDVILREQEALELGIQVNSIKKSNIAKETEKARHQFKAFNTDITAFRQQTEIIKKYQGLRTVKLSDLEKGTYPIYALKEMMDRVKIAMEYNKELVYVMSNQALEKSINCEIPYEKKAIYRDGVYNTITALDQPFGELIIQGYHYTNLRNKSIHCLAKIKVEDLVKPLCLSSCSIGRDFVSTDQVTMEAMEKMEPDKEEPSTETLQAESSQQIPVYQDVKVKYLNQPSLAIFKQPSKVKISAFGYCQHRRKSELLALVAEDWYQAGKYVESIMDTITKDSTLVMERCCKCRVTKRFEARCTVVKDDSTEVHNTLKEQEIRRSPRQGQKRTANFGEDKMSPPNQKCKLSK